MISRRDQPLTPTVTYLWSSQLDNMSYLVLMDLVILSLDGSRQVQEQPDDSISRATMPSILDHYIQRPSDGTFNHMPLLHFAQNYSMPRELGTVPKSIK